MKRAPDLRLSLILCTVLAMACGSTKGAGSASDSAGGGSGGRGAAGMGVVFDDPLTMPPVGGAGGDDGCQRDVSLQAVTLGEPAPFDLIIVADHSGSLAWSRDQLSTGLSNLLMNVQGRDVRVFLLTPTQYGESSSAARLPLLDESVVVWQDPESGKAYQDAMTTYSQTCTSPEGAVIPCPSALGPTPYHVDGKWSFVMPDPIAVLRADMTSAEFRAQQDAVTKAILAIGGTGSPNEQPLCTLARYLSQNASLLPEHATFLLISDEDDKSKPVDCLAGFSGDVRVSKNENGTSPCSSGCDAYRFSMTGSSYSKGYPITCASFDDLGKPIAGTEQMQYASQGGLASCDSVKPGPCTDAEKQSLAWVCDTGKQVTSCNVECAMLGETTCSVDLPTAGVDACTSSFTYQGQTWNNLAAYCATRGSGWHGCGGGGVNISYSENLNGGSSKQSLMQGTTTADIAAYVRMQADAHFQRDAYMVTALVFEPQFSCPLGMGQSYATNLAAFVADPSRLFPLCESYAPVLQGVSDFAQTLIQTHFPVMLKADEDVTLVVVTDKTGNERKLSPPDYSYNRSAAELVIAPSAIHATDAKLRVEITSACRPIVK